MASPVLLVVDDERFVLDTCRDIFKDNYVVVVKQSATEALSYIAENQVDLIFLDIKMPDIDGMEMLNRVQMMDDPPPVVMVTATRTVKSAVAAMKMGAFDYITKPFDIDELRQRAHRARDPPS